MENYETQTFVREKDLQIEKEVQQKDYIALDIKQGKEEVKVVPGRWFWKVLYFNYYENEHEEW